MLVCESRDSALALLPAAVRSHAGKLHLLVKLKEHIYIVLLEWLCTCLLVTPKPHPWTALPSYPHPIHAAFHLSRTPIQGTDIYDVVKCDRFNNVKKILALSPLCACMSLGVIDSRVHIERKKFTHTDFNYLRLDPHK